MRACYAFIVLLLISATGYACPICNSITAKKVRASLLGPDLLYNLVVTIIPFAIFALIILLIYHGGRLPFLSKINK